MTTTPSNNLFGIAPRLFFAAGIAFTAVVAHATEHDAGEPLTAQSPTEQVAQPSQTPVQLESPSHFQDPDYAGILSKIEYLLQTIKTDSLKTTNSTSPDQDSTQLIEALAKLKARDLITDEFLSMILHGADLTPTSYKPGITTLGTEPRRVRIRPTRVSDGLELAVTVKGDDPKCFLGESAWSSCFDGLPDEPAWQTPTHPRVPSPEFWKLRSLWTESAVDLVE